jgi:hypothetical protein
MQKLWKFIKPDNSETSSILAKKDQHQFFLQRTLHNANFLFGKIPQSSQIANITIKYAY